MKKVFVLKGCIQHYAWGGQKYIPELLGIEPDQKPYAEYWMGAHVNAPALVESEVGDLPLNAFLETNPQTFLGKQTFETFGRLPFLFKVLDVHGMLSIQVHPSKKEAEKGFRRENKQGIPLTAANRNYKDDNHKPEIMLALGDFWLLHGFLPKALLIERLNNKQSFRHLLPIFKKGGYKGLYQHVMELSIDDSNSILKPIIDKIMPLFHKGKIDKSNPDYWAAKAILLNHDKDNYDKGIYSIYFFNIVNVKKGQAVFQDAGVPHAYLEGQNIELMANSDNVLRGGLTPKHVDVPELLKHVLFEETQPEILTGELQADGIERKYVSPAPDFELSEVAIGNEDSYSCKTMSAEIYILMKGIAEVTEKNTSLTLKKGESFLALSGAEFQISTSSMALLYKATTP